MSCCGGAGASPAGTGGGVGLPGWTGNNNTPVANSQGAGTSPSTSGTGTMLARTAKGIPVWLVLLVVFVIGYVVRGKR